MAKVTVPKPRPGPAGIPMRINGEDRHVDVDPDMPLLWALRDELKLTGTKFGCGIAQCGACTVWMNCRTRRSCVTPISQAEGADIVTIEAADTREARAVKEAWIAIDVPQCGYCQSGQVMSAAALLAENPKPTDDDIDNAMIGNICRCATYVRIRQAIHDAAEKLEA